MYLVYFGFLLSFFIHAPLNADANTTLPATEGYIDKTHKVVSKKIVTISENIDTRLSRFFESSDDNETLEKDEQTVDSFFQNTKFIEETDETYVSVRFDSFFQSKEPAQYNARVNAQIPLVRSQRNLNIFVKSFNNEITDNLEPKDTQNTEYQPMIGLNYFMPIYENIKSKYSIAAYGLNPLIQARYGIEFPLGMWKLEPTQTFRYSLNDRFEEESNIYLDKQINKFKLFRVVLHRKTKEDMPGVNYALSLQYYFSHKKNTGLSISQSFLGNTEYEFLEKDSLGVEQTKRFGGINNYATSISWRKNIYREWLFYQVSPGINYHKQYDYEPNYTLIFLFDLYFGRLKY
ncbi:hypothetical protein KJ877_09770 [bacterium]|nr:hypothetical protein [bacterium]MBU1990053.1 hypothetical protein [bacterium]